MDSFTDPQSVTPGLVQQRCDSLAQPNAKLDLIKAPPDMPVYTLNAMSVTNRFGKPSVMIQYERKSPGMGIVRLSGMTADGPLKLTGLGMLTDNKGTIELSNLFPNDGSLDAELYLVANGSFAEEVPYSCLVSNVVKVGNYSGIRSLANGMPKRNRPMRRS